MEWSYLSIRLSTSLISFTEIETKTVALLLIQILYDVECALA